MSARFISRIQLCMSCTHRILLGALLLFVFSHDLVHAQTRDKAYEWLKIAREYVKEERFQEAIPFFQQAIRFRTDDGSIHSQLGYVYQLLGEYEKALSEYTLSLGLRGTNLAYVKYNMAMIFASQKKYDEALNYISEALTLDPQYYNAYLNRGIIEIYKEQYKHAYDDLNTFISNNPEHLQKENIEEIMRILEELIVLNQGDFLDEFDKEQYNEKRRLEEELNRTRERLGNEANNFFLKGANTGQ